MFRHSLFLLALCLVLQGCERRGGADDTKPPQLSHQTNLATEGNKRTATSLQIPRQIETSNAAAQLQSLIDPAKLATLGDRGTNTRVQKITGILWDAKIKGQDPTVVAAEAVELIGWGGTERGRLTVAAMVRNVTILERLGGTTPEDLEEMRHGKTATVRKGPYTGEILSVDHIIPRAITPELDNVIANLELMPLSVNQRKGDKVGQRQVALAKSFNAAGLLSDEGLRRVLAAE